MNLKKANLSNVSGGVGVDFSNFYSLDSLADNARSFEIDIEETTTEKSKSSSINKCIGNMCK